MTKQHDIVEERPPGGWSKAYVRVCIRLRGATMEQVVEALADDGFYTDTAACATKMSQLATQGYLRAGDRVACGSCGHKRKVYHATEYGRRYAEVPA